MITIEIGGGPFMFCAAHAGLHDGQFEPLHGHAFTVTLRLHGSLGATGMLTDFQPVKKALAEAIAPLRRRTLVPAHPLRGTCRPDGGQVIIECGGKHYSLPAQDVALLPVANTTTEALGAAARSVRKPPAGPGSASRCCRVSSTKPGKTTLSLPSLLRAGQKAAPGQEITAGGRTWTRVFSAADARRQREHGRAHVRLRDTGTGKVVHIDRQEERTFWEWAIVETLRLSGIRIEELLELSQLSIRQYRRPNGEVIALLVIAPSKTDRERVIPMSAELFTVIAAIICRHTRGGATIPVIPRYDPHERETLPPLPYLFQRPGHADPAVINAGTVVRALKRLCERIAQANPQFAGTVFTPHDFRRLFATELVNSGLPIHIGAALLGHLNLETTRGYVAVFDEDVVRHYQRFLHRRRSQRPTEEYRNITSDEWVEFGEHFDRRKVELGNCARPYGTGCQHEHACLRCPVLQIDPKMIPRLHEIETDLLARRSRAESEGWLGEIEGIDLTLAFLRDKRAQAERTRAGPVIPLAALTSS